jgi:hypothetical protein
MARSSSASDSQTDGADGDSAVSLSSLVRVISLAGEREGERRITLSSGLVHPARIVAGQSSDLPR